MHGLDLKNLYESMKAEAADPRHGPTKFCGALRNWIGLDRDRFGRPTINRERKMLPESFALPELTRAILGDESRAEQIFRLRKSPGGVSLLEAGNAAVQPSQFIDISAWDNSVGGLIEAKVIEGFETPDYIGDKICRLDPRKTNGGKSIGIGRIGDKAEPIAPGQPHPRAQFTERYITVPAATKYGLAVEVTKEAAFFDLTGEVLQQAESVGKEIMLRKEKRILDVLIGITQNPYNYGGVAYNTFLTSGNWVNDQSNPLGDWSNLNLAWYLFQKMTDQESSQRITIKPDTIICTPFLLPTVGYVMNATQIEPLTNPGSSSTLNVGQRTFAPNVTDYFGQPLSSYKVLASSILDQRLTDADGGNLSAANAKQYWWMIDSKRFLAYWENWPLTVEHAPANDYVMADNNLVLAVFANERGLPYVNDPRYAVRNKN